MPLVLTIAVYVIMRDGYWYVPSVLCSFNMLQRVVFRAVFKCTMNKRQHTYAVLLRSQSGAGSAALSDL